MKKAFEFSPAQKQEQERKILERIMEILEEPAMNLLERLRSNIDTLKYDSILGDDVSGRIPALIMGTAIKEIYAGRKKLEAVFVQGGRLMHSKDPFVEQIPLQGPVTKQDVEEGIEAPYGYADVERPTTHAEEVKEYLTRLKPKLGKKTLFVTEEFNSGSSLDKIADILDEIGVEQDIVSFGDTAYGDEESEDTQQTPKGRPIFVGKSGKSGDMGQDEFSGLWASKYKGRSGKGHAVRAWDQNRANVAHARQLIKEAGHRLAQAYLAKEEV